MNVIVGIVSGLPDNETRDTRFTGLCNLLTRINELGPNMPVLIYAQNWNKDNKAHIILNYSNITIHAVEGRPGILKARKTLRKLLLATDNDYFILFDDDAVIETTPEAAEQFIKLMDEHPNGGAFSKHFLPGQEPAKYNPFAHSQLNLCCLSRYIFEKEDLPNFDPEKSEGFEDRIFSMTLLCKYPELRYDLPYDIYCKHFRSGNPSTGAHYKQHNGKRMRENTDVIEKGLMDLYQRKKSQ